MRQVMALEPLQKQVQDLEQALMLLNREIEKEVLAVSKQRDSFSAPGDFFLPPCREKTPVQERKPSPFSS